MEITSTSKSSAATRVQFPSEQDTIAALLTPMYQNPERNFPNCQTYVIFITENDILGENRPLYTIDRTIAESGKLFNDGMHIIYVNSQIRDDTALGRLMHDFLCKNPKEMHYEVLSGNAKLTKERED